MTRRMLLVALLVSAAMGCASTGSGSGGGNRDLLTRAELEERETSSVYDVIRALRPSWLRTQVRAAALTSMPSSGPVVYMDGQPFGEPEVLRNVSASAVESITYMSASQAQNRYRMTDARPVLDVRSRGSR